MAGRIPYNARIFPTAPIDPIFHHTRAVSAITDAKHQFSVLNAAVDGQGPQGLMPASLLALGGTAEAVPFPKPSQKPFRNDL